MSDHRADPTTIYTIGHSNHELAALVALLRRHDIRTLVDVRSSPYAKYAKQFDRPALERALAGEGLTYEFLGHRLGGRPEGQGFYDAEGRVDYGVLSRSAGFQEGLARLLELAQAARVALLCGEEEPTDCHRRLLIGRVLGERGVVMVHIRGDGQAQTEEQVARLQAEARHGAQSLLFDLEEDDGWKSTRSVSPRRPPDSSSGP